ncbi:MAG TPA: serine/threonine-protein kinase, partial [Blastocatellia bacterium]|nr:serine/threonine-protein kinase [Blastocatellia bacterium]
TTIYLRAFTRREALDLIIQPSEEAGLPLRPHADRIIDMAGLFPFYLQIACSTWFDFLASGGKTDEEGIREIEDTFLDEGTVHFHYTWSHFSEDERQVINEFVAGNEVPIEHSYIFKELKKDGYIVDTENGPRIFSNLFVNAISSLRESSMIYLKQQPPKLPPTEPVNYGTPEMKVELARSLKRFIENERKLAHFDIVRRLSEGGMGRIYEAKDTKLQRRVVIKVLSERFARNDVVKRRFLREAQTASQLLHPNIATIFETGEAMGVPYIVMEYITGENLGEILIKRQFSIPEVISIATQTAAALAEAHDHEEHIIHRDIKPGNIMLTDKGQVKVLDFGLAKPSPLGRLAEATPNLDLTEEGMVIGTVRYMSPEQAAGKRDLDARSDIFSLGILLYEITTGFAPFKGESYLDVIEEIKEKEPSPISSLRADAPEELIKIIMKCLNKDPHDRYQSAAEIVKDLKAVPLVAAQER